MAKRDAKGVDVEIDELKVINTSEGVTTALSGNRMQVKLDVAGLPAAGTVDNTMDFVPVYDTSAGTNKKVTLGNIPAGATNSQVPTNAIIVTTPGPYTYNKSVGVRAICVQCIGAGAGGASGTKANAPRPGGPGGGGGGWVEAWYNAADITSSVSCNVGAGGAGGASVSVDTSAGNAGGAGGATSFGNYLLALGGNPSAAPPITTTFQSGGAAVTVGMRISGNGGGTDNITATTGPSNPTYAPAGGGGAGGANGSGTGAAGLSPSAGGRPTWVESTNPAGGVYGAAPTAGTSANNRTDGAPAAGGGGGGSTDTVGVNGAAGGNGGTPGGGGGGGGCCANGVGISGAGGSGGNGGLVIIEFF